MKVTKLEALLQTSLEKLDFFDSNVWLGRPNSPEFCVPSDTSTLLSGLHACGIRRAVVSHFAAKEYDPVVGNTILLDTIATWSDLYGAAVLTPEMAWSKAKFDSYLNNLVARKVRLARLFPQSHNFSLSEWCSRNMLEALAERHLPVVLWHTQVTWGAVYWLCATYPELPVIIEAGARKIFYHDRDYYHLLAELPNLFLGLHGLVNGCGIEDIVGRYGSSRLIFGSNLPVWNPNSAIAMLSLARISQADKERIAYGNLDDLVAGVRLP